MFMRIKDDIKRRSTMEKIYVIEKAWTDCLENERYLAVGYEIIGFTKSRKEAEKIVKNSRKLTMKDCWAINEPIPEFKMKEVSTI